MISFLDFIDMVILSYAKKYKTVDFHDIKNYINASGSFLAQKTRILFECGYLIHTGDEITLSERAKKEKISNWDYLRNILCLNQENEESFSWEELYIPQNLKNE